RGHPALPGRTSGGGASGYDRVPQLAVPAPPSCRGLCGGRGCGESRNRRRVGGAGPNTKMNYEANCARAGGLVADAWTALGDRRRAIEALRKVREMTKHVERSKAPKFLFARLSEIDQRLDTLDTGAGYTQKK